MRHLSKALVPMSLVLLCSLWGCLSLESLTGRFKRDPCYTHTVRWPGETLYLISKWYTGNGDNWRTLARANRGLDPDRIRVGETIRVPEGIMQTRKPLPQEFVQPRSEKHPAQTVSKPPDDPPSLFGPKPYPAR